MRALLPPAHDDDQRVVDRDAESDERDQELHDWRDVGHGRDRVDGQEGRHDRRDRHQQRKHGEERAEHERQDRERAQSAEERLE